MPSEFDTRVLHNEKKYENKGREMTNNEEGNACGIYNEKIREQGKGGIMVTNNEEGNDSCMYTNLFFAPIIVDGALAQPKISHFF